MNKTLSTIAIAISLAAPAYAQDQLADPTRRRPDEVKWDAEIDQNPAKTQAQVQEKLKLLHVEIMTLRFELRQAEGLIDLLKQRIDIVFHAQQAYAEAFQNVARDAPAAMENIDTRLASLQWQINALRVGPIYRTPMKRGWESWSE